MTFVQAYPSSSAARTDDGPNNFVRTPVAWPGLLSTVDLVDGSHSVKLYRCADVSWKTDERLTPSILGWNLAVLADTILFSMLLRRLDRSFVVCVPAEPQKPSQRWEPNQCRGHQTMLKTTRAKQQRRH
jgi:hypothetical protein